jgi:two-component system sensor histidine kinase MprB
VLLAGAIGWVIARSGLRPIQRLTVAVSRVTETDQLEPIEPGGMDELTDLTGAFNTMMRTLYSSRERQRRLIADAGHELRTPLTSLRTNVELLIADDRQGMLPEGARGEILRDIAAQLGEFTQLIGDLVHLSRDDKVEAHPEPIDLRDVLNNAVTRAKRRGPALIFDVEMEPLYLVGEPDSLERAFTNLLDNAVKFSPPAGRIKVRLIGDRVRISDEGPGIAEADLPHVFDRFYRSDKARTTPGSGLGLSIVAQTIKAHGGWVKAGRAGTGGAEFTVRLPGSAEPLDNSSETTGTIPAITE